MLLLFVRGSKNHYNLVPCSEESMLRGIAEQALFFGPGYELEKGGKDSYSKEGTN